MTSPALATLHLALVCSIFGAVSETSADHGGNEKRKTQEILDTIDKNHDIFDEAREIYPLAMPTHRTNFNDFTLRRENYINSEYRYVNNKNNVDKNKVTNIDKVGANKEAFTFFGNVHNVRIHNVAMEVDNKHSAPKRRKRQLPRDDCENFMHTPNKVSISHPLSEDGTTYARAINCETIIDATTHPNNIISLDFVDIFKIEAHPSCDNDYLEIRDGMYGYSKLINRYCGESFPDNVKSTGQYLWLKFHSDETIEYDGFKINVNFVPSNTVKIIPPSCYIDCPKDAKYGVIETAGIPRECLDQSKTQALDVLWTVETDSNKRIYLNFTVFKLSKPNECNENYVEVFGVNTDIPSRLEMFCGSMANSVITKDNRMYVHLYATNRAKDTHFSATYTPFRTLNTQEKCVEDTEFDCEDNTCIDKSLKCDRYAHCRLKADEDHDLCKVETESILGQPNILAILVIFSLILSGMSFVFLFKCIRKLVQDHKIIKEHIRQSCEDRLDSLDVRKLPRDSQPRASLERENHTNEMYKKQRSLSHRKTSSLDSDFIQETQIDEDQWRREVDSLPVETENVRIEHNGRNRRSDFSRKEETMRKDSRREKADPEVKEKKEKKEKKEIRDVSVGAPDTKESSCQTRESLFQAGTASSEGTESGSGGRAFSTFGYSGATLARPSPPAPPAPPAPVAASEITIELLKTYPAQDNKSKKLPDRRPMSSETTRSAPDVIIVSKPIR